MAGAFRAYVLFLIIFGFCVINVEVKSTSRHRSSHSSSSSKHSYPSSSKLSGSHSSSSHSYPTSHSGLSGSYPSSSGSKHSSSGPAIQHHVSTSHGYPSSGSSLSGSGHSTSGTSSHHTYPSSGSVTTFERQKQGTSSHSYPSSGGSLSGSGNLGFPSSTGTSSHHTYPSSGTSLSGSRHAGFPSPTGTSSHTYPSTGSVTSLRKNKTSNTHSYPSSGNKLSGSGHSTKTSIIYPSSGSTKTIYKKYEPHKNSHHTTTVHHYYHYRPPTVITYSYGGYHHSYPVYSNALPSYVYQYRSSGSRYSHLLAGLALYNLGLSTSSSRMHQFHENYKPQKNEICKFGVFYPDIGKREEMNIDCNMITNFIYEEENKPIAAVPKTNVNTTTIITNVTRTFMTNQQTAPVSKTLFGSSNSANTLNMTQYLNNTRGNNSLAYITPEILKNYETIAVIPNNKSVNANFTLNASNVSTFQPIYPGLYNFNVTGVNLNMNSTGALTNTTLNYTNTAFNKSDPSRYLNMTRFNPNMNSFNNVNFGNSNSAFNMSEINSFLSKSFNTSGVNSNINSFNNMNLSNINSAFNKSDINSFVPFNMTGVNQTINRFAPWNVTLGNNPSVLNNSDLISLLSRSQTVSTSSVTTVTTTQVVSAMDPQYRGSPVLITNDMECYLIRYTSISIMKRNVPCGLLETYSAQSLKASGASLYPHLSVTLIIVGQIFIKTLYL